MVSRYLVAATCSGFGRTGRSGWRPTGVRCSGRTTSRSSRCTCGTSATRCMAFICTNSTGATNQRAWFADPHNPLQCTHTSRPRPRHVPSRMCSGHVHCAFDDDEHWHRPDRFGLRCRFVPPPLASVTCEHVEMWAANHAKHAFPACLTTARHEPPLCLRDESAEPAALHCVIGTCTTSERSSGTRTCAGSS
jgi:hypothetical protein